MTSASMPPACTCVLTWSSYWLAGQPVHTTLYLDWPLLNLAIIAFHASWRPGSYWNQLISLSVVGPPPARATRVLVSDPVFARGASGPTAAAATAPTSSSRRRLSELLPPVSGCLSDSSC